jgi:hypothetical protein
MSIFSRESGLAFVLVAVCLGGRTAHAQAAPFTYWIPGAPFGLGGDLTGVQSLNTYSNFPSLDLSGAGGGGLSTASTNLQNGWFVGSRAGTMGLGMNGFTQDDALGTIGSLTYQGVQFGYNLQDETGASPFKVYGGFDAVKYNTAIGNPFTAFNSTANTVTGYSAHGGIEFQAAPNVSLSLGFGYTRQ